MQVGWYLDTKGNKSFGSRRDCCLDRYLPTLPRWNSDRNLDLKYEYKKLSREDVEFATMAQITAWAPTVVINGVLIKEAMNEEEKVWYLC